MTPRDLDAVIFDFGGVLSSSIGTLMGDALGGSGLSLDEFLPLALGPLDDDTDHPWHRLERGEITFAETRDGIAELAREAGLETFPGPPASEDLFERLEPATDMIEAARVTRAAGYRTAILTNNVREFGAWRERWSADELVDVVVESWQVGLRKPAAEIFELTLERLGGVSPERALFLDDFPWNIAGAERAGLQAMRVRDPSSAAAELRERLAI